VLSPPARDLLIEPAPDQAPPHRELDAPSPPPEEPPFDEAIKERLSLLMDQDKPYLNPKLTLSELADLADTNPHELSRAINQGFEMNFNDFVNTYRVEAFKQRVVEPQYQNHTFLAVAMMVGFNSKTAFNRSYKKLTGETPREYFKTVLEE
jgi:AraC-like DNA-binding protein